MENNKLFLISLFLIFDVYGCKTQIKNDYNIDKKSITLMDSVINSNPGNLVFPNPNPDAQWYANAGLGLFMHWGIHSVAGAQPSWDMIANYPGGGKICPPKNYYALANQFNPQNYNPDKWLKAAKTAGFTYAVLTTKHHDGYALWPSDYGIGTKQYMGGRDLLKPYVDACRKNGIKVGFYFSPRDWHYPNFPIDDVDFDYKKRWKYPALKDSAANEKAFEIFLAFTFHQIKELLTKYGKIDILWLDGMGWRGIDDMKTREVYAWIRTLQPGIVINDRWAKVINPDSFDNKGVTVGDFLTASFEVQKPETRPDTWWEHCDLWTQGKGGWGYDSTGTFNSWTYFFDHWIRCRSWGGNFLPNVGPAPDGDMHPNFYKQMSELSKWMEHSKESVVGVEPTPGDSLSNVMITAKDNRWFLHVLPDFNKQIFVKTRKVPKSITLLRNGKKLKYEYHKGEVLLNVPISVRTKMDDVVELRFY